ncbi:zinc finger protein 462 isoform X1 [Dendroctonus ponderosae]|uniref:C2H2-type domain-containing protein n=1 Tax=Dendroctonus ponderosae TaxID=77166 RepID=U4U1V6_DENPD|nr:zinc finger protein 462 isoform X1 [Dendroctonus ponderosae]XP_019763739.2 zinc finger protein 462 isoform X1 [Dendroctonus ponderosae]ERL87824.1 hypothetical protein D910_05213 [Dendroctonus ponderosae]KAH1018060.1 hypothetical protein HUJ05_005885 [Dendroctonus ponderosae]
MNASVEESWTTFWESSESEQDAVSNDVDPQGTRNGKARLGSMANAISPMRSLLKIQCIICKEAIFVDNFSEHIDSCGRNNRETQEMMKGSLERILRNFTPVVQRKRKKSASEAANDIYNVKSLRSGDVSLDPNRRYENVRRGRSKTLLLNSSEKDYDSSQDSCGPWRVTEEKMASNPERPPRLINTDVTTADNSLLLKNSTFSCSLCSYTTFKKARLQKHESLHRVRQAKVLQCFYCSQRYTSGALVVHIREVHPGLEFRFRNIEGAEVTRLACTNCPYKCLLKVQLKNHMRREHSAKTADTRKKILRKLTIVLKRENLEAVKRRLDQLRNVDNAGIASPQSPSPTTSDGESSFECSKCSFACSSNSKFCSHEETHDCKTSESTVVSPRQTPNNVKGTVKLPCTMCSGEFSSTSCLNIHMRTHLRNQPIQKCSQCTFQSSSRCLLRHIRASGHYSGRWQTRILLKKVRKESKLDADEHSTPIDETQSASCFIRKEPIKSGEGSNGFLSESSTSTVSPKATEEDCTSPARPETTYLNLKEEYADIAFGSDDSEALHGDDEDEQLLMKCTLCSFVCTKAHMYKRHLDNHIRLSMPILKCQFCKFTGTKYGFRGHQSRCAGYRTADCAWKAPQEILLTCSGCAFSTNSPGELNAHTQNCMDKNKLLGQ